MCVVCGSVVFFVLCFWTIGCAELKSLACAAHALNDDACVLRCAECLVGPNGEKLA